MIFDGYKDMLSTKGMEQTRRALKFSSTEILFTDDMSITVQQDSFLVKRKNKSRLIKVLMKHMKEAGITASKSSADADALIVRTAIKLSNDRDVVVVGTDVDLLLLLIQLCSQECRIYFFKPGIGNVPGKIYSIKDIHESLPVSKNSLLFMHAITCCDTISALYRQGKKKTFQLLHKNPDLQECINVF